MFLKRIEINGFKSFADKTVIPFDYPITGIVGPNGCGKSNVTDAVRWVLGEQSVNALRGDKGMASIIFAGSASRRTAGAAEVTLVFDNSEHYLNSEYDEVQITRRITRADNESSYYINKNQCRLRDILDLTMDSGLARDSLSVISQGNISEFADAKPEERRGVFEEAAGVSKYKKRKHEAVNKLTRTQENLDRAFDIMNELEQQVTPLANAARKAEKYLEAKTRLDAIETSVLVNDITFYQSKMEEFNHTKFDLETEESVCMTSLQVNENSVNEKKEEVKNLDNDILKLQEEFVRKVSEIQDLENRRTELEEKRKYAIQSGSDKEKVREIRKALEEARFEYESRQKAYDEINAEISLLEKQQTALIMKRIDVDQEYETNSAIVKRLANRKEVLDNLMKRPFSQQAGVQAVMDAINSLPGVLGVVATELKPEDGYEEAISVALGGALYNIITTDPEAARGAINYLKRNQSGRATFLPKNVLRPRYISEEDEIVASHSKGYLGIACDFVTNKEMFDDVRDNLLGSVIVMDDLYNANKVAELLKYRYNVVTLDGDIVHRGGSLTGGKHRESVSYMTLRHEYDGINERLDNANRKMAEIETERAKLNAEKEMIDSKLWENRVNSAKAEPLLDVKRAKLNSLQADYDLLDIKEDDTAEVEETVEFSDQLIIDLEAAKQRREAIEVELKLKRDQRYKTNSEAERKEQQTRVVRKELSEIKDKLNQLNIDIARVELLLNQNMERLNSEYHMTYEFAKTKVTDEVYDNAKEEVQILRKRIQSLGNVNLDAPAEYAEKKERYDQLKTNYDQLTESRDKLLSTISEMDKVMTEQFSDMFNKVNGEFNKVFTQLFGGGSARLYLSDANDMLNTGIEIEAHPPGKMIHTNRSLSGGEKTLIAFCVLFAILRARPIPLCIFDEVDTALDPANNDRFADYVKSLANDSQFLVVTHHPSTMVRCDTLYGITMAQNGVSQVLNVQIDEAEKMVKGAE